MKNGPQSRLSIGETLPDERRDRLRRPRGAVRVTRGRLVMTERHMDFSDLRAVYINCTLKRSPEVSNTEGLAQRSIDIMRAHDVDVEILRAVDHDIATGVQPDMTEHGCARDDWPPIFEKVMAADILVL